MALVDWDGEPPPTPCQGQLECHRTGMALFNQQFDPKIDLANNIRDGELRALIFGVRPSVKKIITAGISLLLMFIGGQSAADELSAEAIAQHYFQLNRGWEKLSANIHMEITRGNRSAERDLSIEMLEKESSGERDLVRVLRPLDLKGTSVLTYTHDRDADEQWIYLPAIKRIKRLTLQSKGGAFLSSQFNFEDLSPFQLQKYRYRRLADETVEGQPCYVLESTPVEASSVYGRLINWIDQADYRLLKTQFFDTDGTLIKELFIEKHEKYRDKYWKPVQLKMVEQATGDSTLSRWSELSYDPQLDESVFEVGSLKRVGF